MPAVLSAYADSTAGHEETPSTSDQFVEGVSFKKEKRGKMKKIIASV